jgi:circadian clock protein KaiC
VFATFEESASELRRNLTSFGWDIPRWEAEGQWAFVDASPEPGDDSIVAGDYDLGALLARIEHAISKVGV